MRAVKGCELEFLAYQTGTDEKKRQGNYGAKSSQLADQIGGLGRNRTTETQIFSPRSKKS
jgi:hypothetical protein